MKYPLSTGGPASLRVQYMLWCCAARLLVPAALFLHWLEACNALIIVFLEVHHSEISHSEGWHPHLEVRKDRSVGIRDLLPRTLVLLQSLESLEVCGRGQFMRSDGASRHGGAGHVCPTTSKRL